MSPDTRLCAEVSVAAGDDPGGTGTPFSAYLALEVPSPWKDDVSDSANFPEGIMDSVRRAFDAGALGKFTALMPDSGYSREGHTRALFVTRPEGPFAAFDKSEYLIPDVKLPDFAAALAGGSDSLAVFEAYRRHIPHVRDVLVCTHGVHDACCGKFGYPVYDRLRAIAGDSRDLRIWRTSHMGGHRFAATLIDLPEGRYWGHLDADDAERVLRRDVPPADIAPKCRGWAGMDGHLEQLAERAVLAREGWGWTGYLKSSRLLDEEAGGEARVLIEYASPDGSASGAYEAEVEPAGSVETLMKSGTGPLEEVGKYRVARLLERPREA